MPTDLPKNFQGSAPKADAPSDAKAALRALRHTFTHHMVFPLAMEYVVCLGLTGIFSVTVLAGPFFQPKVALGVQAAGLLFRWFTQHLKPQQANPFNMPTLTPADLAVAKEALSFLDDHNDGAADAAASKLSPYM